LRAQQACDFIRCDALEAGEAVPPVRVYPAPDTEAMAADEFTLYDLRVDVVAGERAMVCNHKLGDYFLLSGENLSFPPGQSFPLYSLAAILPLLPAKQRETHPNDWMTTDAEIACPDPHCGARFRITRSGKRTFRHSETTRVPLPSRP
jgi:uncharacterized repeat protein (TIGR04076 family)